MSEYGNRSYENMGALGASAQGGDGGSYESMMTGGWATFLCGAAAGAALMYFLDPERGRRRRALLRDKMVGLSNDIGEAATGAARDLSNRAQGLVAEAGSALGMTGRGDEQTGQQENVKHRSATA